MSDESELQHCDKPLLDATITTQLLSQLQKHIVAHKGRCLIRLCLTPNTNGTFAVDGFLDTDNQADMIGLVFADPEAHGEPVEKRFLEELVRMWSNYDYEEKALCYIEGQFKTDSPNINALQVLDLPWAEQKHAHCPCGIRRAEAASCKDH